MIFVPLQILLLLTLALLSEGRLEDTNVQVLFRWRHPTWLYPSDEARQSAEELGLYVPSNGVILDSDFYFTRSTSLKRVFVSTPRFRPGIPATLSEVTRHHQNGSFLLRPFPDRDGQNRKSCDDPVSVQRFHIDKCGILWALDTGRVDTFMNTKRMCPPKIVLYDLNNEDAVLLRYEFPDDLITDHSNLANIITETYQKDCRDSIAYIADTSGYSLVVFDLAHQTSWRVNNPYFYPFPHQATVVSNNVTFESMDGLYAIGLSSQHDADRRLYFHSFASVREGWIPLFVLKNASLASNSSELRKHLTISGEGRTSQSTLEVMTENGILLYALLGRNAIACWNSSTAFVPENQYVIYEDDENLQFVSGMKLKGNALLLTSSRLQNYINDDLLRDEIKYRIIVIDDVNKLLVDTPCTRTTTVSTIPGSNVKFPSTNWPHHNYYSITPSQDENQNVEANQLIRSSFEHKNTSTLDYVDDEC